MLFEELIEVRDPEPHSAVLNMAIDEVLLRSAAKPTLRVYRWSAAALSFGYFGKYASVRARWPERELVRRWTGGGEVPHGADLTYSLFVPAGSTFASLSAPESYERVHRALAPLLGPDAELAKAVDHPPCEACFEGPVRSDVLRFGRKIAGAAQRRTRCGLLHQGSIQFEVDPAVAGHMGRTFASSVEPRSLTCDELRAAEQLALQKYGTSEWLRKY